MIDACVQVWKKRPRLVVLVAALGLIVAPASLEAYSLHRAVGHRNTAQRGFGAWLEHIFFDDMPRFEAVSGAMYVAGIGLALIAAWYTIRRPIKQRSQNRN